MAFKKRYWALAENWCWDLRQSPGPLCRSGACDLSVSTECWTSCRDSREKSSQRHLWGPKNKSQSQKEGEKQSILCPFCGQPFCCIFMIEFFFPLVLLFKKNWSILNIFLFPKHYLNLLAFFVPITIYVTQAHHHLYLYLDYLVASFWSSTFWAPTYLSPSSLSHQNVPPKVEI